MKDAFDLLKQAAWDWFDDSAPTLGAAVAYYTVFSLAPLFVIAVFIAGLVFGQEAAQGQIFEQLRALIGEPSAARWKTLSKVPIQSRRPACLPPSSDLLS
jgi:membrane protein